MKIAILATLLLFQLTVFGQNSQKILLDKILPELKILEANKVDSIIYFMPYFTGGHRIITIERNTTEEEQKRKICEVSDIVFLVWQQNGKIYVTKYNECWRFKTIMVDSLDFISQFSDSTCSNDPKQFQSISENGNLTTSEIDHCGFWDFYAKIGKVECKKSIDSYELSETYTFADKTSSNINYTYNKELPLIKMLTKLNRQLHNIHFEKE